MTIWDLPRMIRRNWPVALVGLLVTLLAGAWIAHRPGVYYEQINVIFVLPDTPNRENPLQSGDANLIRTAGIVTRLVSNQWTGPQPVSDSATLLGQGVRHGYSVRLPNSGGQWAYNFDRPQLSVEVAGSSPDEVTTVMTQVLGKVNSTLTRLQDDQRVRQSLRIQTRLSPPVSSVAYVTGSRIRALAVTEVLGISITLSAVLAVERRRPGGRRDRPTSRVADTTLQPV